MHLYAQRREHGLLGREAAYKSTFLPQHASALTLEHTLSAHGGCVNRIHWDETGSRLVSGSDDRKLLIWEYPDVKRLPVALTTRHRANIFGAHILPQTNGYKVVSCSMDRTVQLHELPPDALNVPYGTGAHLSDEATTVAGGISQPRTVQPRTTNYTCHSSRVKDVEVEPMNPHNFWSASEDGTVRQFDCRCRTDEQSFPDSSNLLVHVRDGKGDTVELKSLDICQAHPHLLAIACSDPYVRIYDRRKLSLTSPENLRWRGTQPLLQLAPAHLAIGNRTSAAHSTYVCFSQKGDRLVTSYHGDHAYAFDVTSAGCTSAVYPVPRSVIPHVAGEGNGWKAVSLLPPSPYLQQSSGSSSSAKGEDKPLPISAAWERDAAEQAAKDKHFLSAMEHYDRALHLAPWSAALWSQRAEALLSRGWAGDAMWALRDCDVCLAIDPCFWQARLQRGRALKAMGQIKAALGAVQDAAAAQAHYPGGGHSHDREAERQIAELREQLEARLHEMEEERERERKRLKRIRSRRKVQNETMRGSAIRRRGASPGAGTLAADTEGGSNQQGAATQPLLQQEQQQQQEGGRGGPGDRERVEEGGQRMSAVGEELVGRDEATDASGEESERHREDSDSEGESEEEEEEDEVFAEYYGFDVAEDEGPYVGPQLFSRGRAQRHPCSSHSVGSSMESRRQGVSTEKMVQGAMPGGPRILQRYMGHINVQTDIKEATYLGGGDALVACGSDDGKVYIYDASTGMPLRVLQADQDVVNCVQSHPHLPVLATSGIEDVIRLWTPGETGLAGVAHRSKLEEQVLHNQERVSDVPQGIPVAALNSLMECPHLMSLLLGGPAQRREGDATDSDDEEGGPANVRCRVN